MISGKRESSFTLQEKTNTYGGKIKFKPGKDILKPEGCLRVSSDHRGRSYLTVFGKPLLIRYIKMSKH